MDTTCDTVKGNRYVNLGGYTAIRNCVISGTIHRWYETSLTNGSILINFPQLRTEAVDLDYIKEEEGKLRNWN